MGDGTTTDYVIVPNVLKSAASALSVYRVWVLGGVSS